MGFSIRVDSTGMSFQEITIGYTDRRVVPNDQSITRLLYRNGWESPFMGFVSLPQKSYLINVIQKSLWYYNTMASDPTNQVERYYKY